MMRETFKVGQHVRLVSGGGCDAANGFTDGDICEVESRGNAGKYDLRIRGLTHRTIGYVNADQLEALTPTLDETTNPADVEWGEVRSAVAEKDWRRAWEVVGTDHEGEATPGEAYIFGNARRLACVSAALIAWRGVALPIPSSGLRSSLSEVREIGARVLARNARWQRIKTIAAWESSAAAQYVEPKAKRARAWRDALERNTISTPRTVGGPFGVTADTVIIDDPEPVTGLFRNPWVDPSPTGDEILRDLRAMQELVNAQSSARPTTLWLDESMHERLRDMRPVGPASETYTLTLNGERQTYTVPASAMPDIAGALRDYIGQPLTAATRAAIEATVRRVTQDSARVASGNAAISPNPAPHGPNRRRRR